MKLLAGAIAVIAGLVIALSSGASLISDLRGQVSGLTSQVKELLPGGDAYSLGLAEGEKILNSAKNDIQRLEALKAETQN